MARRKERKHGFNNSNISISQTFSRIFFESVILYYYCIKRALPIKEKVCAKMAAYRVRAQLIYMCYLYYAYYVSYTRNARAAFCSVHVRNTNQTNSSKLHESITDSFLYRLFSSRAASVSAEVCVRVIVIMLVRSCSVLFFWWTILKWNTYLNGRVKWVFMMMISWWQTLHSCFWYSLILAEYIAIL